MSVESVLLSEGGSALIKKILLFYSHLVIKNNVEAEREETKESLEHFQRYEAAYYKYDDFSYYEDVITEERMVNAMISRSIIDIAIYNPQYLNEWKDDFHVLTFLNTLREEFLINYEDLNPYYRILSGKPPNDSQIIWIVNQDVIGGDPIRIDELDSLKTPITYEDILLAGGINSIIKSYSDHEYLNYIRKPIKPMTARKATQFHIMAFNTSILSDVELDYFMTAYEDTVEYIMDKYYNDGYESVYTEYSNMMLFQILIGTFSKFIVSYAKKYSLADYSDTDILKIIESENMPKLLGINIDILRKVVYNLDYLKNEMGKEKVLKSLLDMVSTDNSTVRRYVLAKRYKVDKYGNTLLDPTKSYYDNVDLEFIDQELTNDSSITALGKLRIPYDDFVLTDSMFGGTKYIDDEATRGDIRQQLKHEILKRDFDVCRTKYISISNIIYTHDPYLKSVDMFGLGIQLYKSSSFIFTEQIQFENIPCTLFDLFILSSWCGSNILYEGVESDEIKSNVTHVYSTMSLIFLGSYLHSNGSLPFPL